MKKHLPFWFFGAILAICTLACNARFFDIDEVAPISPTFALPIADTSKSVRELVMNLDSQATLQVLPDGGLNLHYTANSQSRNSVDIFADYQNAFFQVKDTITTLPLRLPQGAEIDFADLKNGKLAYFMTVKQVTDITITIPQLVKNGIPFQWKFRVSPTFLPTQDSIDISNYRMNLNRDSLRVFYSARKVSDGTKIKLDPYLLIINNFQAQYAQGYLGRGVFESPRDTIALNLVKQIKVQNIRFSNPKMTLTLDNSFGTPVRSQVVIAQVIDEKGNALALTGIDVQNGVNINYPRLAEAGTTKRTVAILDKNNSNLPDLISSKPVLIDYQINGLYNPDADRSITGFFTDSSAFRLNVELDVPLEGSIQNFEASDTFNINLSENKELQNAEFKIVTDNELPLDVFVQGYFQTVDNQVVDSLFTETAKGQVMKSAIVDGNGKVIAPSQQTIYAPLDATRLTKLQTARKVIVKYRFTSAANGTKAVSLRAEQKVRVRIGVKAGLKIGN